MGEYINVKTAIAFTLGVVLAAYIKSLLAQAQSKVAG